MVIFICLNHCFEMLWCEVNVHNCRILQCILHFNHLISSNLIWTWSEFCWTIHHISDIHHIMEHLAELDLLFVHSNLSLTPLITNDRYLLYLNTGKFCACHEKLKLTRKRKLFCAMSWQVSPKERWTKLHKSLCCSFRRNPTGFGFSNS